MKENLDNFDLAILRRLQNDCAMSIDQLADRVTLSRNACWRRVKRMEQDGVITGRVALLDPEKIDLGLTVFILIKTNSHDPEWLAAFRSAIREMQEIVGAHRMSGDLDYVLRVRISDVKAYDAFYQRLIARIPIADVSASFVMEDIKDTTALPL